MQLHDPWLLTLLLLVPLVLRATRAQRPATLRYPLLDAVRAVGPGARTRWRWLAPALRVAAFGLLVVALARPQLGKASSQVSTEGIDILLAVDISGSMEYEEALTQRRGYVEALRHPEVVRAITSGLLGRVAVTVVEWAGPGIQFNSVPWTVVHDQASADQVSSAVAALPLVQYRGTSISSSLLFASRLFEDNGFVVVLEDAAPVGSTQPARRVLSK